jgi:NAD(P)-dependent dehydrogenase (short-subunit alcohol dehydrogenase family)
VLPLDVTDRVSVGTFVAEWAGPLDIMVCNAGVSGIPERYTPDGWEYNFAANYLGHFALALGLRGALVAAGNSRIVALSSCSHVLSPGAIHFDDIHFEHRPYTPPLAYAQSKTANVLFGVEATKRWADDRIFVNAVHPGGVRTNLHRSREDAALVAMVDELCECNDITELTWVELARPYSPRQLVELVLLVGYYRMVSGVLNAVGVEREPWTPGWPTQ